MLIHEILYELCVYLFVRHHTNGCMRVHLGRPVTCLERAAEHLEQDPLFNSLSVRAEIHDHVITRIKDIPVFANPYKHGQIGRMHVIIPITKLFLHENHLCQNHLIMTH